MSVTGLGRNLGGAGSWLPVISYAKKVSVDTQTSPEDASGFPCYIQVVYMVHLVHTSSNRIISSVASEEAKQLADSIARSAERYTCCMVLMLVAHFSVLSKHACRFQIQKNVHGMWVFVPFETFETASRLVPSADSSSQQGQFVADIGKDPVLQRPVRMTSLQSVKQRSFPGQPNNSISYDFNFIMHQVCHNMSQCHFFFP